MSSVTHELNEVGNVVSLFTGAGGLDIGFYRAGFNILWANDIDKYATKTYQELFPDHDVRTGNLLDQNIPPFKNVDLVIGGPPCQGFSVAGKMDPSDPRSQHVWNFMGVVDKLKPRGFVMENVKALAVNIRWSELVRKLHKEAKNLGYSTRLMLLNAAHYGVPQARERMFLVGVKEGEIENPPKTTGEKFVTLRTALEKLPEYGSRGNDTFCTAKITPAKKPILRKSPYAGMLFNGQGRPLNINMPALTLPASMGGNRTPIIDQDQVKDSATSSWVEMYHRSLLKGEEPTDTVPNNLRRITVEEAAVIQTFPLNMNFIGTNTNKFKQIGNAVPPELAFHVAQSLRKTLTRQQ